MSHGQLAAGADPRIIERIQKSSGKIWYVSTSGGDSNPGNEPNRPFATIGYAITSASVGDMIRVGAGTYDENGLDVSKSLHIVGEYGAKIVDTTTGTQTLLISANYCYIDTIEVGQAGQIGIKITGTDNLFNGIVVSAATVALDVDGARNTFVSSRAYGYTTTGFDLSADRPYLHECVASGSGGATRGFYLSNTACNFGMFKCLSSSGNTTAGLEIVTGSDNHVFNQFLSGGEDGRRINLGSGNVFSSFICEGDEEHTEHVYPWDSLDPIVTPGNQAWGNIKVLVPIDGIVSSDVWNGSTVVPWELIGLHIALTAVGGKGDPFTWQIMRIVKATQQSLDGDANSGQKVVPVPTTANYLVDDIVWLTDDDTVDGEIGKVASIQTDTSLTLEVNLVNSYTTAQNAKVYLARREAAGFESWEGKSQWNTELDVVEHRLHEHRAMANGDGLIARSYGISNADPTAYFGVIYDEG